MAGIPKEHEGLYFDTLCRTQKKETVLSLIYATYQAKKSGVSNIKEEIAKRLENAYNLFRTNIRGTDSGSGTYSGNDKQFESQYTIGHELCIWANSDLDLTPYALTVAEGKMAIKEYFDIFFLSYFQPINGKAIHVLYLILKYMIDFGTNEIEKRYIPDALGVKADKEAINALCNFLSDTSYITYKDNKLSYVGDEPINLFINRCNIQYLGAEGLEKAKRELNTDEEYAAYIMSGRLKSKDEAYQKPSALYFKFKHLLSWFVKQLNVNNGLEEGIKTAGRGCDGSAIQSKYAEWRDYGSFTLDCSMQCGYLSTSSRVNYIQKSNTRINVRPKFNKNTKEVISVSLDPGPYNDDLTSFDTAIVRLLDIEYPIADLLLFDGLEPNDKVKELFDNYCKLIDTFSPKEEAKIDYDSCERLQTGANIILYGVPGVGKSYTIEHEYSDADTKKERVVFHPDYTYSDFVGQILPKSENGNVTYQFTPGPFTKIVDEAYHNPMKKFILVIEEINRGNAPAIFGDIFQLLDRNEDGSSSYGIINSDIAKIVYGDDCHEVKLPSNLSIICTMNTSDQNVFTLDTAFQRRWDMRLVENVFKKDTPEEKEFAEQPILDTDISWEDFCEAINELILEKSQNMTSSEDKRLGTHFVNIEDLIETKPEKMDGWSDGLSDEAKETLRKQASLKNKRFPEKVIKYLWDDAFKFYRDEIFNDEYDSLEKIIGKFCKESSNDRFNIFKDEIKAALEEKTNKASSGK